MKLEEWFHKYFGQKRNTKVLFLILLLGVLLMILSGTTKKESGKKVETESKNSFRQTEYTDVLERRLEKALQSVRGAGKVSVMITLADSGQNIYAQDEQAEKKLSGSSDSSVSNSSENAFVLKNDSGGGQSPILIRNDLPKISGVLVTAEGADNAEVKSNLLNAVKAVLDVKAHRVQVLCRQ